MTTKAFLELLGNNPQKELVFEYEDNQFIPVYQKNIKRLPNYGLVRKIP